MSDQNKTKSQLIAELNELRQKVNSQEQELSEKKTVEAGLTALIESREHAVWSIDKNYKLTYLNQYLKNDFKKVFSHELKLGTNVLQKIPEKIRKFWKSKYDEALSGKKVEFEFSENMSNKPNFFNVFLNPIVLNGTVNGVSAISINITEQKTALELLKESENRLSVIFNHSSDLQVLFEVETFKRYRVIAVNRRYLKALELTGLGLSEQDVIGKTKDQLAFEIFKIDKKTYNQTQKKYEQVIKNKIPLTYEENQKIGKTVFYSEISLIPILDDKNKCTKILWSSHDITDRKRTEESLRLSEEKFQKVFHNSPDAIILTSLINGELIEVNDRTCEITGYSREELIGKTSLELDLWANPKDRQKYIEELQKYGRVADMPADFRMKSGEIKNGSLSGEIVSIDNEKCILGTIGDVTEKIQLEKARDEAFDIINRSPAVAFLWRNENGWPVEYVSDNVKAVLGYSANEFMSGNKNYSDIIHPDDLERVQAEVQKNSQNPKNKKFEHKPYRVITKNGKIIWLEDLTYIRRDRNNNVTHFQGVILNVTDRIEAAEALRISENRFQAFMENLPSLVMIKDEKLRPIYANRALKKFFPYKKWEGKTPEQNHPKDIAQSMRQADLEALKAGYIRYEEEWKDKKGKNRIFATHKFRIDRLNESPMLGVIITDITEQKLAERELAETKSLLEAAIAHSPSGILIADAPNVTIRVGNPAAFNIRGGNPQVLTNIDVEKHAITWQTFYPDGNPYPPEQLPLSRAVLKGEITNDEEVIIRDEKNIDHWVSVTAAPIYDQNKIITAGIVVFHDITDRKTAEQNIKESEARFRAIIQSVKEGIIYTDQNGTVLHVNNAISELVNIPSEQLIGKNAVQIVKKLFSKNEIPKLLKKISRTLSGYSLKPFELNFRDRILEITTNFDKSLMRVTGIVRDITERKEIENALKENEHKLRNVVENSTNLFYSHKTDHEITYISPQCRDFLQCDPEEAMVRWTEFITDNPINEIGFKHTLKAIKTGKRQPVYELELQGKEGKIIYVEVNEAPVVQKKKTIGIVGSLTDITKRKEVEIALRESEEKYRLIVENAHDGIEITQNDQVIFANSCFADMLGYTLDEIKDTPFSRFFTEQALYDLTDRAKKRKNGTSLPHNYETTFYKKDGSVIDVDVKYEIINYKNKPATFAIIRDITDRKKSEAERNKLEKQLRQAQKLETIGTLAGGIAHDFNNILAPIMGYTDMALHRVPKNDPLYDDLDQVLQSAHRAKDLVAQILLFSKQSEKDRKPVKLQDQVSEVLKLLRHSIPTTVAITQHIDDKCDFVQADPTQIHQVLVNLCTNAWQAMEEHGGTLTVELSQVLVDSAQAKLYPNLIETEYARLSIIDTGMGMSEQTLERIFEPFFTTKAVNKGTGLGLSVVHGIVRSHKGEIIVNSQPGKGSAFHVYLPVIKSNIKNVIKTNGKISSGSEYVMVVDDETTVAQMVKRMLENSGYKTEVFNNAKDALESIKKQPKKYDLLISDLTMPQITGLDLSDQIQKIKKDLPVIIMTGYGNNITKETQKRYRIKKVIGKPVVISELSEAVREVLDS